MDLMRIKYFIELCRCKNYTNTAERLYISQPALSRHIHLLEQELGIALVEHNRKKFQLTPEGEAFLKLAKDFQQHEKDFEMAYSNLKTDSRPVLRVGFPVYFSISKFFSAIETLYEKCPDLLIDFSTYPQQVHMLPDLINDNIDIAIACRSILGDIPRLNYELIAEHCVAILLSNRHRLWGRKSVSVEELRGEDIYSPLREINSEAFQGVVNYLRRSDIFLEDYGSDQGFEEQLLRVFKGDCISMDQMFGSDLVFNVPEYVARIPVADSHIGTNDIFVAYKHHTSEIQTLIECLKEAFPSFIAD